MNREAESRITCSWTWSITRWRYPSQGKNRQVGTDGNPCGDRYYGSLIPHDRNTSINYLNRKVCCRETHSRISRWGGEDFSNEVQEDKPERDIWSHVTVCEFWRSLWEETHTHAQSESARPKWRKCAQCEELVEVSNSEHMLNRLLIRKKIISLSEKCPKDMDKQFIHMSDKHEKEDVCPHKAIVTFRASLWGGRHKPKNKRE